MSETKLYRNPVLFVITVSHEDAFCIGLCQMCIHMFLLFVCQRSSREIRFFPETFRNLFRKRFCKFSGRIYCTKYLRVRLEFLRYPQFIRRLFNGGRFGPPWNFTSTST